MGLAWLDFDAIRRQARFAKILDHYGFKTVGTGEQRFILCPFHSESTPSCSVHLAKGLFHCFGCGAAGSIFDFVAMMERCELRAAAEVVANLFPLSEQRNGAISAERSNVSHTPPLSRTLSLDPSHPYLVGRGLSPEAIAVFGLGYCSCGPMQGRICIPIHDAEGRLIAYAGRWAGESVPEHVHRYMLPRGFRKSLVLFNLHRIPDARSIVLVEGYWSAIRLHQLGLPVAGLMGTSISAAQIALLANRGTRYVTLLFDGDEAGFRARERALPPVAALFFARSPLLPAGEKPDSLPEEHLIELLKC